MSSHAQFVPDPCGYGWCCVVTEDKCCVGIHNSCCHCVNGDILSGMSVFPVVEVCCTVGCLVPIYLLGPIYLLSYLGTQIRASAICCPADNFALSRSSCCGSCRLSNLFSCVGCGCICPLHPWLVSRLACESLGNSCCFTTAIGPPDNRSSINQSSWGRRVLIAPQMSGSCRIHMIRWNYGQKSIEA